MFSDGEGVGTPGAVVAAAGDFGGGETETHLMVSVSWNLREVDVLLLSKDFCGINE